jgi:tetraacyldisaccharide 4'-kinase
MKADFKAGFPSVPVFFSEHRPATLWRYGDKAGFPLDWLQGKRLVAFCGLAAPQSLTASLKQIGADPLHLVEFPDHHFYRDKDKRSLEALGRSLKGEVLVTTEKDALKLGEWKVDDLQVMVLGIEIEIEDPAFGDWLDQQTGMRLEE